jgi:hypothetical protein
LSKKCARLFFLTRFAFNNSHFNSNRSNFRALNRPATSKTALLLRWCGMLAMAVVCHQAMATGITTDITVSHDQNSPAGNVTSPVFSTTSGGELLLAFVSADKADRSNTTVRSVVGGGLTWVLVERTNAQSGTAEIWRAFAPAVLKNVTVTATLSESVVSSITVSSFAGVAQTGTNGSGAIGAIGSGNASHGAPSARLVTTQNNSFVVGVGDDFDNAIPRTLLSGETLLHQDLSSTQDTYWVQRMTAPTALKSTGVTLGDSAPTTDRYNFSICEILPATPASPVTSTMGLSASALNFGNVTDGATKLLPLTLTSTGTSAVTISSDSITGAGFLISSGTLPATLSPGQSLTLQIEFAPKTTGTGAGKLTVNSNSSSGSQALITLAGTGVATTDPQVAFSASSVAFGAVTDGTTKSLPLTVSSTGTSAVTVSSDSITGTGFLISSGTLPATLSPGQSLTLQIEYAPKTAGGVTGQLTINSNSTTNGNASIALSGTGTAPAAPKLTLSATTLPFGSVTDGSSESLSLTLSSTGTSSVTINSASVTGTGFSIGSTTWPQTLAAGQTLSLPIKFAPTAAGAITGQLTINSNSSTGSASVVALTGTGTAPAAPKLTLSATTLPFGSVTDGSSESLSLTLSSTGTSSVTINSASVTGTGFSIGSTTWPQTLAAGQTLSLPIKFAPTAAGAVTGQLTINSNSSTGSVSVVALTGTGTAPAAPKLTLSATTLPFGGVTDGSSNTLSLTLSSSGTSTLTISSASITGTGFTIVAGSWPQTLAVGQSLTLQIKFAPTIAGAVTGQLTINSNSTTGATSGVTLTGTGSAATSPKLTLSVTSLSFGTVTAGSSTTESVTLTSTGTSAVTVSSATVTGTGFSIVGRSFPISLSPGATASVTIEYLPSSAGAATGQLTVNSNSTPTSTFTVALSGTGEAVTHSVDLSWDAPGSSPVAITGYHIYRMAAGSAAFTLLNSTVDTATSYVDSTVSAGTTYSYEIKSVDAAGVESSASNQYTVAIP